MQPNHPWAATRYVQLLAHVTRNEPHRFDDINWPATYRHLCHLEDRGLIGALSGGHARHRFRVTDVELGGPHETD